MKMQNIPVKIAVVYAFIGALWILLSDWLLRILVSDPVCLYRRHHRGLDWNPTAEAILGFKREEVLGKNSMDLIAPPETRPFLAGVIERLLSGDMTAHATNENTTKDGRASNSALATFVPPATLPSQRTT